MMKATKPMKQARPSEARRIALQRCGFTLMELLIVVSLLAIFVASVAVNYRGPLQEARLQNSQERLEDMDRRLRMVACNQGQSLELQIDMEEGEFSLADRTERDTFTESYKLPGGVRLDAVYVGQDRMFGREAIVRFSSSGTTPTYALGLTGKKGRTRWLLFIGLTGQMTEFDDHRDLRPFLSVGKSGGEGAR